MAIRCAGEEHCNKKSGAVRGIFKLLLLTFARRTPTMMALIVLCALATIVAPAIGQLKAAQAESPAEVPAASSERGEQMFSGHLRFENGGPPCAYCHSIAGLPFANGGTLGPNLTHAYGKFGPVGMNVMLKTLYFPAMFPLYDPHPLTDAEQADLLAFFKTADTKAPPPNITPIVAVIAVVGLGIFVLITWVVWRNRLTSVRRPLVERAMKQQGRISS